MPGGLDNGKRYSPETRTTIALAAIVTAEMQSAGNMPVTFVLPLEVEVPVDVSALGLSDWSICTHSESAGSGKGVLCSLLELLDGLVLLFAWASSCSISTCAKFGNIMLAWHVDAMPHSASSTVATHQRNGYIKRLSTIVPV